ncbi:HD-GYP domain-containing protein [Anaerolinea sp.]|uniref:HD-GYP domain-containing protein n=1 Tax=Anaerolinea sp. TaxID=1872519 RepID=UPI0026344C2A|nr:HD-GYP domain-containing protein [uncultured Anaerolinea sp.]
MRREGLEMAFALPLIAHGELVGTLGVAMRSLFHPNREWEDFLDTVAGQLALAIQSHRLVEQLRRSNQELLLAYDTTIEGWSRAMDLRDRETEGHTQRVTQLTLKLAQRMGITGQALTHLRRGALLHDIGKMGVPDAILHKPGPLTDEEWQVMRQHPVYAIDMLSSIEYLKPALDIPGFHHEKWDGSGYPYGLKGEAIPLGARIFAVVDVYDALTSDRPYRKAWTREKALEYICEQAGKHFDPRVVEAFLKMMEEEGS